MGNLYLLPSKQRLENGAFWLLRGFIHDLGGAGGGVVGFGASFFMIPSKIVAPWGVPII